MKQKLMGWQPEANDKFAFVAGSVGAFVQMLLNIHLPTDFWQKLIEAAITAAVCGFVGVAGKELYRVVRNAVKDYFNNKKKNNVGKN